jgi:hypothetical protein
VEVSWSPILAAVDVTWLDLLLLLGFAARLIRLAVVDRIAAPFRNAVRWVGDRLGGERGLLWADDLVSCPFCIGFWISVGVVASWALVGGTVAWRLTAGAFALSYLAGHAAARLDVGD